MVLVFLVLEGLASLFVVARQMMPAPTPIVGQYTQFDPELGWVTIPNVYIENLFGKGAYFRSNAQGFRNTEVFSKEIPAGKFRIVCSGDSFTLGSGVSNDQTWCQQLRGMDQRIQTVNMGEVAYGIDQVYLSYLRDGSKLDLNLQFLAFIDDDFARMTYSYHWGYGKPTVEIEDGRLVAKNVPVRRYSRLWPAITDRLPQLNNLRTLQVLRHFFPATTSKDAEQGYWKRQTQALPVTFKIFQTLRDVQEQKRALFVAVYMPSVSDCRGEKSDDDKLRDIVAEESKKIGVRFWDLTLDCRQLPSQEVNNLYLGPEQIGAYHPSAEGNAFIARTLYRKMMETPEIAAAIERATQAKPEAH